jgi:hypothetical protein
MSKNTISSLAMLKTNYYIHKRDYIEIFIPFVATLINKKGYTEIEIQDLSRDFQKEFGLEIPYHPMQSILIRAKKRGIVTKFSKKWKPVKQQLIKYEFSGEALEQLRKQEKIINEIPKYAKDKYNFNMSNDEAEDAFISFLKDYDLDILFATQEKSLLPSVKPSKKHKFMVFSYIKNSYEREPEIFHYIVDTAIGHLMANTILYNEYNRFVSKLRGVYIYLDTRIILRLLGLEGEDRKIIYKDFLETLTKEGACVRIFKHTYEETIKIIEDCLKWVENPYYDRSLASPVLEYFVSNSYTKIDILSFMERMDQVLEEDGINNDSVVEAPAKSENIEYQIDESKLQDIIIETYKKNNPFLNEYEKEQIIKRDIDSIAAISKLRRGNIPRYLKDVGSVFMTTNSQLAYSSRKFEFEGNDRSFFIPACITDTFVGTILWLQSPAKILKINKRKIIAECFAALKPEPKLIRRYLLEIDKLKNETKISETQYYYLRKNHVAFDLLSEKTLGDPDNFNSNVLNEILEEMTSDIRKEISKKYFQEEEKYIYEREEHIKTKEKLEKAQKEIDERKKRIEIRAEQVSKIVSNFIMYVFLSAFLLGTLSAILFKSKLLIKIILYTFSTVIGFLNVGYGFNIKGFRNKIKRFIKYKVAKLLDTKL